MTSKDSTWSNKNQDDDDHFEPEVLYASPPAPARKQIASKTDALDKFAQEVLAEFMATESGVEEMEVDEGTTTEQAADTTNMESYVATNDITPNRTMNGSSDFSEVFCISPPDQSQNLVVEDMKMKMKNKKNRKSRVEEEDCIIVLSDSDMESEDSGQTGKQKGQNDECLPSTSGTAKEMEEIELDEQDMREIFEYDFQAKLDRMNIKTVLEKLEKRKNTIKAENEGKVIDVIDLVDEEEECKEANRILKEAIPLIDLTGDGEPDELEVWEEDLLRIDPCKWEYQQAERPQVPWHSTRMRKKLGYKGIAIFDTNCIGLVAMAVARRMLAVIPQAVLRELDALKVVRTRKSKESRVSSRILQTLMKNPRTKNFIEIETTVEAAIDIPDMKAAVGINDDLILQCAMRVKAEVLSICLVRPEKVFLVTCDRNLSLNAMAHFVNVLDDKEFKWEMSQIREIRGMKIGKDQMRQKQRPEKTFEFQKEARRAGLFTVPSDFHYSRYEEINWTEQHEKEWQNLNEEDRVKKAEASENRMREELRKMQQTVATMKRNQGKQQHNAIPRRKNEPKKKKNKNKRYFNADDGGVLKVFGDSPFNFSQPCSSQPSSSKPVKEEGEWK